MSASRIWISAISCGSCSVSASSSSRVRSTSALSTTSIRLSGPLGASWARRPTRQRDGSSMSPCSAATSWVMTLNRVLLPLPLRPTNPMREPSGMRTEACSIRSRPAMRTERSSMMSMARSMAERGAPRNPQCCAALLRAAPWPERCCAHSRRCESRRAPTGGGRSCVFPDARRRCKPRSAGVDSSREPPRRALPRPSSSRPRPPKRSP